MDSGCDVHFTRDRCWIAKDDGKDLDMIRSGGVFFVAARPTKSMRDSEALELNPITLTEIEQAALARENVVFGDPGPKAEDAMIGDGDPSVRIRVPTGLASPTSEEKSMHEASGHVPYRSWCQWCVAARAPDKRHLRADPTLVEESGLPRIEAKRC